MEVGRGRRNERSEEENEIGISRNDREYRNRGNGTEEPRRLLGERITNLRNNYRDSNRIRRIEAVTISSQNRESFADILRKIKQNINIREIGITETRIRRAATGNLLIQIEGEDCKGKADILAERMKGVVAKKLE